MRITIHEAEFIPKHWAHFRWRDASREALMKRLAAECRANWDDTSHWRDEEDETKERPIPTIPDTDEETVATYFWGSSEELDNPWIEWEEFHVDIPDEEIINYAREITVKHECKNAECKNEGGPAGA